MVFTRKRHLVFALICAFLSGVSAFFFLLDAARPRTGSRNVIIAAQDISRGQTITAAMIDVDFVGPKVASKYAASDVAEVLNKVAGSTFFKGEPILTSKLSSSDQGSEIAYLVDENKLAIAIPADPVTAVGNRIRPGDRIDVFVTGEGDEIGGSETKLLFTNIKVIAVGAASSDMDDGQGVLGGGSASAVDEPIIIEVSPEEAKKITYFSENAKLRFALRSKGGLE